MKLLYWILLFKCLHLHSANEETYRRQTLYLSVTLHTYLCPGVKLSRVWFCA